MTRNTVILAALAAVLPLACAETMTEAAAPIEVKDAKNCYRLSPELYRSGQPGDDGFKALEKLGLKSILNLREYHSDADEAEHTGLHLYRIKLAAGSVTREELMNSCWSSTARPNPFWCTAGTAPTAPALSAPPTASSCRDGNRKKRLRN